MKPLVVANWKCNPLTIREAKELFDSVNKGVKGIKKAEVVICPPFVYLPLLKASGAQDCFWEEKGAYTGEISPPMLKDLGCQYVIIGHSERRRYFEEGDEMINKKIKAALKSGLNPIFCIGETEKERKKGEAGKVLKRQIELGLKGVSSATLRGVSRFTRSSKLQASRFSIAYEPVWAIGTGNPCGVEEAKETASVIRKVSKGIPLLYGGSVNSENAAGYIKEAGYQGLLVGGASLKAGEFIQIVKAAI